MIDKQTQFFEIIKCCKDPVYFVNEYIKIQSPIHGTVPFKTYNYQECCINDFEKNRINVLVKARQIGASTTVNAYALWLAIFHRDQNILIVSYKKSAAQGLLKKIKNMMKLLPQWIVMPDITRNTLNIIEFSNGSSIEATSARSDCGCSITQNLLIVDEASFIRNFDEIWCGLYPTLSHGGKAIISSTLRSPHDRFNRMYLESLETDSPFKSSVLPWYSVPGRDCDWLEAEKNACVNHHNDSTFNREYLCKF